MQNQDPAPIKIAEIENVLSKQFGEPIEHHETHVSDVFLVGQFAFKFKKHVKFDFLDFSSLEKRRAACEDEVRLNRRLAPDVYLSVAFIVRNENGEIGICDSVDADDKTIVESAVKMRRLSNENTLEHLLNNHEVDDHKLNALANLLVNFYSKLKRTSISANQYRDVFRHHILDNRNVLLDLLGRSGNQHQIAMIERIHSRQLEFLALNHAIFEKQTGNAQLSAGEMESRDSGWIVEGHGDLRPDHIYFDPEPLVIDCIEFNREYRTIDIVDELSFLAMQCEYLEAEQTGNSIMERVLTTLGCDSGSELIAFYKSYRACVRAKVAALTKPHDDAPEVHVHAEGITQLLEIADKNASAIGAPCVLMVRGLMGTGKTTLATEIANVFGARHLQTDAIRIEVFGRREANAPYGDNLYTQENRNQVYDEMLKRMSTALQNGFSVVLDGTFLKSATRQRFVDVANEQDARFLLINCVLPEEETLKRIAQRCEEGNSLSDARPDLYRAQQSEEELPVHHLDQVDVEQVAVDTRNSLDVQTALVFDQLSGNTGMQK